MSYNYQAPNLADILNNLVASQAKAQSQQAEAKNQLQVGHVAQYQQVQVAQPVQAQIPPQQDERQFQQIWQQQLNRATQPQTIVDTAPPSNTTKIIDPTTIIEWSAGLKCVMKTVSKHDHVMNDIRQMIKVQNEHEEQWWQGRKALIEKQAARKEGQKKLDAVLQAVGGAMSIAPSTSSAGGFAREIETYDMKVYKAQLVMNREMSSKLKNMGVPFFGTRTELVRPITKHNRDGSAVPRANEEKGVINEIELVKLQRKMLDILEDLCRD